MGPAMSTSISMDSGMVSFSPLRGPDTSVPAIVRMEPHSMPINGTICELVIIGDLLHSVGENCNDTMPIVSLDVDERSQNESDNKKY